MVVQKAHFFRVRFDRSTQIRTRNKIYKDGSYLISGVVFRSQYINPLFGLHHTPGACNLQGPIETCYATEDRLLIYSS